MTRAHSERLEDGLWGVARYWRDRYLKMFQASLKWRKAYEEEAVAREHYELLNAEREEEAAKQTELLEAPWTCILPGCNSEVPKGVAICVRCRVGNARSVGWYSP